VVVSHRAEVTINNIVEVLTFFVGFNNSFYLHIRAGAKNFNESIFICSKTLCKHIKLCILSSDISSIKFANNSTFCWPQNTLKIVICLLIFLGHTPSPTSSVQSQDYKLSFLVCSILCNKHFHFLISQIHQTNFSFVPLSLSSWIGRTKFAYLVLWSIWSITILYWNKLTSQNHIKEF